VEDKCERINTPLQYFGAVLSHICRAEMILKKIIFDFSKIIAKNGCSERVI
jgi:hypothetical protein